MDKVIISNLYNNPTYLNYLRYHPKWYMILERYPSAYKDFEKQLKIDLKITAKDKIEQLRKQIDFVNSLIKYINSN